MYNKLLCLQEHPSLTKAERKKLCSLMDVKKLTMDASMHAAQNERLPLRLVVQVLFFEQVRSAAGVQPLCDTSHSTTNTDEESEKTAAEGCNSLEKQMSQIKIKEDAFQEKCELAKQSSKNSKSGIQLLPCRSRRMFDKLWGFGKGHADNRSSETSASSQSPTSMVPGDTKSSSSSSRNRRHSIS